jgi:hypothetical protein
VTADSGRGKPVPEWLDRTQKKRLCGRRGAPVLRGGLLLLPPGAEEKRGVHSGETTNPHVAWVSRPLKCRTNKGPAQIEALVIQSAPQIVPIICYKCLNREIPLMGITYILK